MKKSTWILLIAMTAATYGYGQELGVRFGDTVGNDVAIDGVFALKKSRVHANVSFGSGGVGVAAIFDFIFKPLGERHYTGMQESEFLLFLAILLVLVYPLNWDLNIVLKMSLSRWGLIGGPHLFWWRIPALLLTGSVLMQDLFSNYKTINC